MGKLQQKFRSVTYTLGVVGLGLMLLSACQARKRQAIEVAPEKPPQGQADGGDDIQRQPGDDFNDWSPGGDNGSTAELRAAFTQEQLEPYVDLNASLEYEFKYLTHNDSGSIKFNNGTAEIIFRDLTVGQSGTLTLEIKENGKVVLRGEKANLTLKGGRNPVDLTLKEVGGGGDDDGADDGDDDKAELVLTLSIEGSGGDDTGDDDGGTDDAGQTGGDFNAVKEIAEASCKGAGCHAIRGDTDDPSTEAFWKGEGARTKEAILDCITGGCPSFSGPMPVAGTRQAGTFGSAERKILQDFLNKN